jgi:hypothetical protein
MEITQFLYIYIMESIYKPSTFDSVAVVIVENFIFLSLMWILINNPSSINHTPVHSARERKNLYNRFQLILSIIALIVTLFFSFANFKLLY